jgi:hypothetical protein
MKMPLCYSFATSLDGSVKKASAEQLAKRIRQDVFTSKNKMPTKEHFCAFLTGQYQYLLKFRYEALHDVASAVLHSRGEFRGMLGQTLTMLEYPNHDNLEPVPILEAQRLEPRGIWLVQEHLSNDVGTEKFSGFFNALNLFKCTQHILGRIYGCTDVFGPYDYVVEFQASNEQQARRKIAALKELDGVRMRVFRDTLLFCEPFLDECGRNPDEM